MELGSSPDTPARQEYPPTPTDPKGSAASVPVPEHQPDKTLAGGYRNTFFFCECTIQKTSAVRYMDAVTLQGQRVCVCASFNALIICSTVCATLA